MIVVSLAASLALLVLVVRAVRNHDLPGPKVFLTCLGFSVLPMMWMTFLPVVVVQSVLLVITLEVLLLWNRGRKFYPPAAVLATVIAWCGVAIGTVLSQRGELAALREKYAIQSLEDRLPLVSAGSKSQIDSAWLEELETDLSRDATRADELRSLHEDRVRQFVNSPGFGVSRMSGPVAGVRLFRGRGEDRSPVPQPEPGQQTPPTDSPNGTPDPNRPGLAQLNQGAIVDFANPEGFGWVKDRKHVAGFVPHGMTRVPDAGKDWSVRHLDLVGLVVHTEPVAYVSENLPRMDELKAAPTRPLDPFEAEGLTALRGGDDLFVRPTADGARVLGAVRSVKQCVDCHGGSRGDLLGAFSYTLRRE